MKIAYIVNEDITKYCGVIQKMRSQTVVWKNAGHEVKFFSLSARGTTSLLDNGVIVGRKVPRWGVKKLAGYFKRTNRLRNKLHSYNPDLIYMRPFIYFPYTLSILKACAPYIIEINTNDVKEFEKRFKKYRVYNLLTRGILLSHAAGFVSVSHELSENSYFKKYKKPTVVIGNGIDVRAVEKKQKDDVDLKSPLQVVFIGSPNYQFWHGFDKIVYLAEKLPDVNFHIIGPAVEDMMKVDSNFENMNNIQAYGYLSEEQSQAIVKKCDVAISTLSLYLKGMEEASPLKSRQYLAQGIPMIVGYDDTDLSGLELPFILNIGNYEGNVKDNLSVIKGFIFNSREFVASDIQEVAAKYLDGEKKELKRLDFFQQILSESVA